MTGLRRWSRALKRLSAGSLLAASLAVAPGPDAFAQSAATTSAEPNVAPRADPATLAQIQARRDVLFARMLANPGDLDTAFEYAALSSQAGDLEGAIATLERMLIFAPGLPRLQLELGVLYYRLGAYETAKTYFDGAISGPNVPEPVRAKVETYLAAIDDNQAIDTFSGVIVSGLRWQSNANAAPGDSRIRLNGVDFLLDGSALGKSDTNGFVAGSFRYFRDLENQGDRLEATLKTYGALYADQDDLNTGLAELTLGPVFDLQRFRIDGASLGLYGILGGVVLGGDPYLATAGVGSNFVKLLDRRTRLVVNGEYRHENFKDSDLRPTVSDRTGDRFIGSVAIQHQFSPAFIGFASLGGDRRDADVGYDSVTEVNLSVGGRLNFAAPIAMPTNDPWTAGITLGYVHRDYDDPDPVFSTSAAQETEEGFVEGTLEVPIRDNWSVQAAASYRDVRSNYDLYSYDNVSTSLGIAKRF
ncbi:outer membrane beta-barrel protein [Jiella mangrovi]|uniref:Outer membrane beta-barrel protein n=1 Tax=Jiella mangrovi TaxID=2821407 RepID=A0ABS4BLS7_9HYPH|nr:outer membrane beta-barrel protein [Jiella mangrovi]MBP0617679.1 outer membrane beta-barrel protein [Jiella mangrovi]